MLLFGFDRAQEDRGIAGSGRAGWAHEGFRRLAGGCGWAKVHICPPLAHYAWTGAQYPGDLAVLAENCQDWTVGTSASEAWMGEYAETNADYFSINAVFGPSTLTFKADCSRQLHLYCLER